MKNVMITKYGDFYICRGYERYYIDEFGSIYDSFKDDYCGLYEYASGVLYAIIECNGYKHKVTQFEMYARAFPDGDINKKLVCINGNKNDLNIANMVWGNPRDIFSEKDDTEWREIEEFADRYEVNTNGDIRNSYSGKLLKIFCDNKGNTFAYLYGSDGKRYKRSVALIVAKAFLKKNFTEKNVVHINGNKKDNRYSNLKWGHDKKHKFETAPLDEYDCNGNFVRSWSSIKSAAKENKISYMQIFKCCRGKYKTAGGRVWRYKGDTYDKYPVPPRFELLEGEVFKDIKGARYAQISNMGRCVCTKDFIRLRKPDKKGRINIMINGKRTMRLIASLVADTFLPNPKGYHHVDYIDGNSGNVKLENLKWKRED